MKKGIVGLFQRYAWLACSVAVLFAFLGTRGLNEPDEGRYAEIAREMAQSGDWLVPTLNGFEHFQKPPLIYWLTALSIRVFGANEWSARLPSALAALGTIWLTYLIALRLCSGTVARNAALILVSSLEFFALARLLTPDMTLTFWITAALAAFVHRRHWLFFVAMGLGFLTKGPMAVVVPLSAALAWQITSRGTAEIRHLPWGRGTLVVLGVGLSWFIMLSLQSPELLSYFWKYELVQRFASRTHGRSQPWWFFLPVITLALLPWTFFLVKPLRTFWHRWQTGTVSPPQALLAGWVVLPFVILTCSGSKLVTYVLPLLPALAIAIGSSFTSTRRVWKIAVPAMACWLLAAINVDHFGPYLARQASVKDLAEALEAEANSEDAILFTCGVRAHGLAFYAEELVSTTRGDADIVLPLAPAQLARVFRNARHCLDSLSTGALAYGIVDQERFASSFKPKGWRALRTEGDFVLITNRDSRSLVQNR